MSDEMLSRSRPATEVAPHIVARYRGQRGPQVKPTKTLVSLRLDPDVIAHFKAGGSGWQSQVNEALRRVAETESRSPPRATGSQG